MSSQNRDRYAYLDKLTDEEISEFKESGRIKFIEPFQVPDRKARAVPKRPETIVAEGDSWLDYFPGTDIIDCLRNLHNYPIDNFAKAGDTLENMIYGTGINSRFQRTTPSIVKVLSQLKKLKPKIFLFSGGGNDVAGDEFESYLNHKESGLPIVQNKRVAYMVDTVFKKYFEDLISKVNAVSPRTHIVTHGYGYTKATGKGVNFFLFTWAGPWLKPALARKGIFDSRSQNRAVKKLIDRYNELLKSLDQSFHNFHHVDLRNEIDPKKDWVNELHLRNSAYARVADLIHDAIKGIKKLP